MEHPDFILRAREIVQAIAPMTATVAHERMISEALQAVRGRKTAPDFDRAYLRGFEACYRQICKHLPLESLQYLDWKELVDVNDMITSRKEAT